MREIFLLCFTVPIFLIVASPSNLQGRTNTALFGENTFYPLFGDTILNLDDSLRFELADCSFAVEICIGVPIGEISNYQLTTNGVAYTNGIAGCDFDTSNFYSYTGLFGQGNLGPYILQSWTINTSIFSSPFNSMQELVDSMNVWDPTGNWVLDATFQTISGGTAGFTYSDMSIYVLTINTVNTLIQSDIYIPQGTLLFINSGATELIITESATGATDSTFIIASCAQAETISDIVFVNQSGIYCMDFSELPGSVSTVTNICPSAEVDFLLVNGDSCVQFTGLAMGSDTACIVACDIFGVCDTTYLIISALPALGTQEIFDTIFVGEGAQWCADLSVFMGTVDTIYNICPGSSGIFAGFSIDENTYCVDYTGLSSLGTDMGCFVVCDDLNNCDTTNINVTVRAIGLHYYYDTLYVNEVASFCDWDESNLLGPVVNIENGCIGSSGTAAFFDLDVINFCISYDALDIGKDTACIYLTDNFGNVDTTIAIVCVLAPESSTLFDTIRLSLSPTYCVDTTELAGNIVSIENICPGGSGDAIDFIIDATSYCILASPVAGGTDSICIVICDEFGICDTTTFIITVEEEEVILNTPIAFDDVDTTTQNTSVIIDACANDSIPANLIITNFFALPVASGGIGPMNGTAFSNLDCTISYVPNEDYCGNDSITYVLCNQMGCDSATITVTVICPSEGFEIFNAFSPNGDGVNDYFRINGIEDFPDHTLYVFNRWGNQVLKVNSYQNDWGGTWQGLDLPDGTYYYVFDTGTGISNTGYVYLGR
jgi:gliding motility-associated-like protein